MSVTAAPANGSAIENLATIDAAATTAISLTGNTTSANALTGNTGNNVLNGGAGADTLNGLGGNDMLLCRQRRRRGDRGRPAAAATAWALASSAALGGRVQVEIPSTTNNAGTTAINLTGNGFRQLIAGNNGDNVLNGGAGADTPGSSAATTCFYVDNAGDVVIEAAGGRRADRGAHESVSYALVRAAQVETL